MERCCSSVLSLAILTWPAYSAASSLRIGVITRQGGHHGAQKSTTTGSGEGNTSSAKLASVTTIGLPTAIYALIVFFLSCKAAHIPARATCSDDLADARLKV